MENKKLVYAVDDEAAILEVYTYALEGAGFDVECFTDADGLFAALKTKKPDIFILDIMLEGLDGYEILKRLRQDSECADIPVIMVSAKGDEIDKVKGLNLGADDYISKPFGVLELVARINAKLRTAKKPQNKFVYKDIVVDDDKHEASVNGEKLTLTLKQYELLKLLVSSSEKVLDRDFILDSVWGENYGETRTLDIHIGDLRRLLSSSQAEITTIRGVGYVLK
ncbi:MAG TPA: DNA-binding response regulator [Clostridiales bacterium]|nr:DNA-binding response regulator [Clostridiales bacterium]